MAEDKANVAIKFDKDKLKFNLIPPEAEKALAEILTMGAAKYGDRNWENGLDEERILASLRRHLNAYQLGEKTDPESGYSHLKHALCNAAFLVTMEERQDKQAGMYFTVESEQALNRLYKLLGG